MANDLVLTWRTVVEKGTVDDAQKLLVSNPGLVNERFDGCSYSSWLWYGITALHVAIWKRRVEMCHVLLKHGADMESVDTDWKQTPLLMAATEGHLPVLQLLVDAGCDVNSKDIRKRTPLLMAATEGHLSVLRLLVDAGCDVNSRDIEGNTALQVAIRRGDVEMCRVLLEHGADMEIVDTRWKRTPIVRAAEEGHLPVLQLLVDAGCDVNSRDKYGNTALHMAIGRGDVKMCRVLLEHGADLKSIATQWRQKLLLIAAETKFFSVLQLLVDDGYDVNSKDIGGDTALHVAVRRGDVEMCRVLLEYGADMESIDTQWKQTPLVMAAEKGHFPVFRLLVDAGCDVNSRDKLRKSGSTALHVVIRRGDVEMCHVLLEHGADVKSVDTQWKRTLLVMAAETGSLPVLQFLVDAGCDVNSTDIYGNTALHVASRRGGVEMCRVLLEHGADMESVDTLWTRTPLLMAARESHLPVFQLLVDAGCDVHSRDHEGITALHVVSRRGDVEMCRVLLEHGADVKSVETQWKQTPLLMAVREGHLPVSQLLVDAGCDVNSRDIEGNTALHVAIRRRDVEMCRFLLKHGADMEGVATKEKETPFQMAAGIGCVPILHLLINAGCDVPPGTEETDGPLAKASRYGHFEAVQFLVANGLNVNERHDTFGQTALHWACSKNHKSLAEFLILSGADVTTRTKDGKLPHELADEPLRTTVKFAQLYGEGTVTLECVKICLIGPPEAGKTTVFKAIRRGWLVRFVSADETAEETSAFEERTVGMDVFEANISSAGRVVLCDFAGQRHFHRTHSLFFGPSNTIYILLINGKHSEEQMLADCQFWLAFLSASVPPHSRPVVVIVVSRADLHPNPAHLRSIINSVVSKLKKLFEVKLNIQQRHFILDCRKSQSSQMKELRSFIADIKNELLQTKMKYPRVCVPIVKKLLPQLRKMMANPLMTHTEFVEAVKELFAAEGQLVVYWDLVVDFLNTVGEVFAFDDLIFFVISWLSSAVLGPVLETRCWLNHINPHCATATKEQLAAIINEFQRIVKSNHVEIDGDHAVKALEYLGVCFELEDHPGLYCIPAHLPEKDRQELWLVDPEMKIHMGRRVKCQDETDMFTPGLFAFFQSHVVVKKIDPKAKVFKGWMKVVKEQDGGVITEGLVEVSSCERAIDVVVRGAAGSKQQCLSFLNAIMDALAKVMSEKSQGTQVDKYLLSPKHLRQARKNPAAIKEEEVVEAQRKNKDKNKTVRMTDGDDNVAERVDELLFGEREVDPARVVLAVLKLGSERWYALGRAMEFSRDQLLRWTDSLPQHMSYLQAVFHQATLQFGERRAADKLLKACGDIADPIIGQVHEEVSKSQHA